MPLQIQIIDDMIGNNPVFLLSPAGVPYQYESGAQASETVARYQRLNAGSTLPKRYRIVKVEAEKSDTATKQWRSRERARFEAGYYESVPWVNESWFRNSDHYDSHYCHMSRDKSAMVAYTESDSKGRDDIQKRVRPGRYLTQYFGPKSDCDVIGENDIRYWAGKVSLVCGESSEVSFATTPDDIEDVYKNGPNSCMSHESSHYEGSCHPTRVYGAGDLAIAYLERDSSIAARCISWPEKKIFGRIYGDGGTFSRQLESLLESDGYHKSHDHEDWDGARLLRIEHNEGFVIPYFDIPGGATDCGAILRVSYRGEIETDNESGVSEPCGQDCDNCGSRYNDENSGGAISDSNYCDSCFCDLSFCCEDCEETGFVEDSYHIDGADKYVCDSCASNYPSCDSCGERNDSDSCSYVESMGETFCESCFADKCVCCDQCGDSVANGSTVESCDGDSVCESCAESMVECIECDKYEEPDKCFVDSDGDSWCSACRQSCLEFTESESESK